MSGDIVYIRDLRIDTYIGIYDWEQQVRQTVCLNIELAADIARTAAEDDIGATLDYAAIAQRLIEHIDGQHFQLLETLAEQCAQLIMAEFSVPWLRLQLGKPDAVAAASDVGVIIERGQRS